MDMAFTSDWQRQQTTRSFTHADCRVAIADLIELFWLGNQCNEYELVRNLIKSIGFEKFQDSREEKVNGGAEEFFYDEHEGATVQCYLNCLGILDNGADAAAGKRYFLILDRSDWESDDLEELEIRLFCWALTEGWTV